MTTVCYSLACVGDSARERQWASSVRTLRRYNDEIEVVLSVYGDAQPETLELAREARVHVEPRGSYFDALGDLPRHWRAALVAYPQLHKLISLAHLPAGGAEPLLYLDCDTYFFGDVAALPARYGVCQWYAREEPHSSRSSYGYYPEHVDEAALEALALAEGLVPTPPYNTGVFLISPGLATVLRTLLEDFLWYAWRLLLGACLWKPELIFEPWLRPFVLEHARPSERTLALPYPSGSGWILEQVATWLTLGRVPGLTHDTLAREDVAQGGEYADFGGYIVAHYYTAGEEQFFAHLARGGQGG